MLNDVSKKRQALAEKYKKIMSYRENAEMSDYEDDNQFEQYDATQHDLSRTALAQKYRKILEQREKEQQCNTDYNVEDEWNDDGFIDLREVYESLDDKSLDGDSFECSLSENTEFEISDSSVYKSFDEIDSMSGKEFELYCIQLLQTRGFKKLYTTPDSNDYGADIIGFDNDNAKWIFQCKRYSNTVGNSSIQEIVAAKKYYNAKKCGVITNSVFTKNAITLAETNHVVLFDRTSELFRQG